MPADAAAPTIDDPQPMNRTYRGVAITGLAALGLLVAGAITIADPRGAPPTANIANAPTLANHANAPPTARHRNGPRSAKHANNPPAGHPPRGPANRPARDAQPPPGPFRLLVDTAAATINVPVAPFSVASHQIVDPPHSTMRQWNTADWITQSTYPDQPSHGTAYIYGHACEFIVCSFNDLINARVGDTVHITTRTAQLTYRIVRIGLGTKYARSLPAWAADSTVPNRVVLVTCAYKADWSSPNNLIVVAHLSHQSTL